MKILRILSLLAVACASTINLGSNNPVYGYIRNIGIPLAEKILEEETRATLAKSGGPSKIIGGSYATLTKIPYQVKYVHILRAKHIL